MVPDRENDKVAVVDWVKDMFRSMGEGDFEKFCNGCSETIRLYPPNTKPHIGMASMKKLTQPWFETFNMSHVISEITVQTDSNTAYAFAQYVDTIIPKKGGEKQVTPNKAIYILRRESDNSWKASDIIWNRNPPTEWSET